MVTLFLLLFLCKIRLYINVMKAFDGYYWK
jgi:hypothetical protein